ncbi:flap endonuclease GEN homolog 1 [Lacerta agilis]|uniref:flap endonuclease GEN homolog 1 n=1 Tax=Lacerta agilis TaxID=80427 RepID=UPI001419991E|nr:flap endonuclease GEN homolog 1 [Lacerta agilis]
MGVTSLWQILEPVKQHVPLSSLKGKTLAVDLSLWVCEAQTVKKMVGIVRKPHLRNLYFRVSLLTLMGVHLVFVTEGESPELKEDTMRKRTEARFGPSSKPRRARTGRSRFKSLLKECLEMLECLGVPWVQAAGEAEATCAYLNLNGYVDACITNDGDAFLYGAQTVYRNFTMNTKDPHIDCYSILAIEKTLGCNRESLIGLAVLLGCDYLPKGVPGVGKEQALKLIKTLRGESLLQRFAHWKDHFQDDDIPALAANKVIHCAVCRHPGAYKDHESAGCRLCGSAACCEPHDAEFCCPCDWHSSEQDRRVSAVENGIKKKAKACKGFPFPEVIQEYLISKDKPMKLNGYRRPNLLSFQKFAFEKMDWSKHYACEKLCVLLTYYDMNRRKSGHFDPQQLQARRIIKTRTKNGIPCFEIEWQKPDHYTTADDQPAEPFLITTEEASLFEAAYPEVVAQYHMEKLEICKQRNKGKKNKPKEGEHLAGDSEIADLLSRLNMRSDEETFPSRDPKPPFTTVSGFQTVPEKGSKFQGLPVTVHFPTAVTQIQNPPSTLLVTTLQNTEYNCIPDGSLSSQPENLRASSQIAHLQLSDIDWEGTSFSVSPKRVNIACSESESDVSSNFPNQHSSLPCKTAEIITPSLNSVRYDPNLPGSEECSVSKIDLHKGQNDLSSEERAILKPSALEASPSVSDMSLLNSLQMVEQINVTASPVGKALSPSAQLNDSAQEVESILPGKYLQGLGLPNLLKNYENPARASHNLTSPGTSVSLGTGTRKPTCLGNKSPILSRKSTEVLDSCRMRGKPTHKSSLKKSVCQKIYSSEDSDGENVKGRKKGHRGPKWRRKGRVVQLKDKCGDKRSSHELVAEVVPGEKSLKGPAINLPVEELPIANIHNSLTHSESKLCRSFLPLQASEAAACADSPLPLSERLKLRLQSS